MNANTAKNFSELQINIIAAKTPTKQIVIPVNIGEGNSISIGEANQAHLVARKMLVKCLKPVW